MPKLTAFAGDPGEGMDYTVEGIPVQPWTDTLKILKNKVEEIAGVNFTHVLLNLYRDGNDGVSWHRDKERHWGAEPVIGSLTLGAARIFQMRNTADKKVIRSIELAPGSLLIMKGASQRCWEHQIPKTTRRIGARLNITFRVLKQNQPTGNYKK
jgi:alkylated DNA repair dioxygenase AlkB